MAALVFGCSTETVGASTGCPLLLMTGLPAYDEFLVVSPSFILANPWHEATGDTRDLRKAHVIFGPLPGSRVIGDLIFTPLLFRTDKTKDTISRISATAYIAKR